MNTEKKDSMKITVVEIDEEKLFIGAKVRLKGSRVVKTIISDDNHHRLVHSAPKKLKDKIAVSTVLLNKTRFDLVQED